MDTQDDEESPEVVCMKVKLLDERCRPEQHGDWCDLRVYELKEVSSKSEDWTFVSTTPGCGHVETIQCVGERNGLITYKNNSMCKVSLGVSIEIPEGYHA